MRRFLAVGLLLAGCASPLAPAPSPPPPDALAAEVASRAGFLLVQIAERDGRIRELEQQLADERSLVAELRESVRYQKALTVAASAEVYRLAPELAEAQELVRTRTRQVVGAFAKLQPRDVAVETLQQERDTCFVQLAEATLKR